MVFVLTMPGVASWDGVWSGEGNRYAVAMYLNEQAIDKLELPNSWRHHWKDGWCAEINARLMQKGERLGKTQGLYGYEWMIDNILEYGRTEACPEESDHVWQPEEAWRGSRPGEWQRCTKCRTSRKVTA